MINEARVKYGAYFQNAFDFNSLLQTFIKEIKPEAWIFGAFLSQIRKHHTLALFSEVRLHGVQSKMNIRQVIEAGCNAAYGIAHDNQDDYVVKDERGYLQCPKELSEKRYGWLAENYKDTSDFLLKQKELINDSASHSNIVYTFRNFGVAKNEKRQFETPFFDFEDNLYIKVNLWFIGNLALGLMDLFYGVNQKYDNIKFIDDFVSQLRKLEKENHCLKAEIEKNERIKSKIEEEKLYNISRID